MLQVLLKAMHEGLLYSHRISLRCQGLKLVSHGLTIGYLQSFEARTLSFINAASATLFLHLDFFSPLQQDD